MSFEALTAIRHVETPGASATLLLFILAEYAGPDGCCFPSQKTLSERSKLSERAVRDNMALLEEAGLIVQERRTRKDGTRTSNRIRLLYYRAEEALEEGVDGFETKSAGGKTPAAKSAASLGEQSDDQRRQTSSQPAADAGLTTFEPVSEPITLSKRAIDDAFAKWWDVYPRAEERVAARRAYEIAVRELGGDVDQLLAEAQRYAISVHGTEARWIKKPATWLQAECWRGEPRSQTSTTSEAEPQLGLARTAFAGPAELRAAIVAVRGEDWTASWLDPCAWDDELRTLIPHLRIAGDRIRQELGPQLREWRVIVGEPVRQSP